MHAVEKDTWEWDEASLSRLAEDDPAAFWALVHRTFERMALLCTVHERKREQLNQRTQQPA